MSLADKTQCIICLSDEGEVVQKGCHCRGDNGAVHIDCLTELAAHHSGTRDEWQAWEICGTCNAAFGGDTALRLAKAWFYRVESREPEDCARIDALECLARVTSDQVGDSAETERMFQDVVDVRTRVLGPEHPDTLAALHVLAQSHTGRGKVEEALQLYLTVVEAMERVLGEESESALSARESLADLQRKNGDPRTALASLRKVLAISEVKFGPDAEVTLDTLQALSTACGQAGEMEEAMQLSTDLLDRRKRVQGAFHHDTLRSLAMHSILLCRQEQYAGAVALVEEELLLMETHHPTNTYAITIAKHNVGLYKLLNGDAVTSEPVLRQAVEETRSFSANEHLYAKASHGLALSQLGRHDEAVALLRETREAQDQQQGSESAYTLRTASILGGALVAQGQVEQGATLLKATLAAQSRTLGEQDYDTRQTAKLLAQLLPGSGSAIEVAT